MFAATNFCCAAGGLALGIKIARASRGEIAFACA
jgi:hypothetical protein